MLRDLSPEYLRRLLLPTTRTDLVPADAAGESGSVVGGGAARITLRFERPLGSARAPAAPRKIREARVRVLASAAPHGPAAVLLERVTGAEEAAARALTAADLLAPLGPSLPPLVAKAATSLVESLRAALDHGEAAARTDAPGVLVCRCLGIGDRVVRRAVRGGARDVPMIGLDCSAGTGCHSCWPDLRAILDEETHPPVAPPTRAAPALDAVIFGLVAPLWRAQGLSLAGVRVVGETVLVAVGGAERDALASPVGAVATARHALREALSDTVRVELDPLAAG